MKNYKEYFNKKTGEFQSDQYPGMKKNEFVIDMETVEGRSAIKAYISHINAYGGDHRIAHVLDKNIKKLESQLLT